jgi:hypothetical protein
MFCFTAARPMKSNKGVKTRNTSIVLFFTYNRGHVYDNYEFRLSELPKNFLHKHLLGSIKHLLGSEAGIWRSNL